MLQRLATANCLYMDGTFYSVPGIYHQLYTIHIWINKSMICAAYFLLPNRQKETYVQMLQFLQAKVPNGMNPQRIQVDFEKAMMSAVKIVFPQCSIVGCYFHYTQAIWRKVQSVRLQGDYTAGNADVEYVVRSLIALPHVRIEDIPHGFNLANSIAIDHSDTQIRSKLKDLMDYFESTWLNEGSRFPPAEWNRHGIPGPRTNNHIEGWHSKLNKMVGRAHANLYIFIQTIKKMEDAFKLKLIHLQAGVQVSRKNGKYQRLESDLNSALNLYNSDSMPLSLFMMRVGKLAHLV